MRNRNNPVRGAVNAHQQVITTYGGDPQGTAIIQGVYRENLNSVAGGSGTFYAGDRGAGTYSYHGSHPGTFQRFMGAAALRVYGTAKSSAGGSPQLDTAIAIDSLNDAGLRIFAARAARMGVWS